MNSVKNLKTNQLVTHPQPLASIASERQISNQPDVVTTMNILSKLSFLVVSHVNFSGHAQELVEFLRPRSNKLMFISHPFSYAPQKESTATLYARAHHNHVAIINRKLGRQ